MPSFDLNTLFAVLSVILAAVVLPSGAAVVILVFALGVLVGDRLRAPPTN